MYAKTRGIMMSYDPFGGWTPLVRPGCGGGRSGPATFVRSDPMDYGTRVWERRIEVLSLHNSGQSTRIISPDDPDFLLAQEALSKDSNAIKPPSNMPRKDIGSLPSSVVRNSPNLNRQKVKNLCEVKGPKVRNLSEMNIPKVRNLSDKSNH